MNRSKVIVIGLLLIILLMGCTHVSGEDQLPESFDYNYEVVNPSGIHDSELKQWYENNRKNYGFYEYQQDSTTHYLLVGAGQRSSGGYALEITGLTEIDRSIFFKIDLTTPTSDEMVIQALTYPNMLIKITGNQPFEAEAELSYTRASQTELTEEPKHFQGVHGIYTGQIDNNFIEIDLSSNPSFQSKAKIPNDYFALMVQEDQKETLDSIEEGSEIYFNCYQNHNKVWILEEFIE